MNQTETTYLKYVHVTLQTTSLTWACIYIDYGVW